MKKFHYMIDGVTKQGPLEISTLLDMRKRSQLPAATTVCADGSTVWQPLSAAGRQEKIGGIAGFALPMILAVALGVWHHQDERRRGEKKQNQMAAMAQRALTSGTLDDYQASFQYEDALKLLHAGSFQIALRELNSAISLKSDDARYFIARANAKERLGDREGALGDTSRAHDLGAKVPPAGIPRPFLK